MKINTESLHSLKLNKSVMSPIISRKFTSLLFLLFYSSFSYSALFINQSTEKLIQSSDLIIKGYVKEKHTQLELTKINSVQVIGNKKRYYQTEREIIITTFVIVVQNVYWGKYKQSEIEVKMEGGCYQEDCVYYSYNYEYKLNDETLIFLKFDGDNKYYVSTSQAYSVFEIEGNKLKRKSESYSENENNINYSKDNKNSITFNQGLTIDSLKKSIMEVKNENK